MDTSGYDGPDLNSPIFYAKPVSESSLRARFGSILSEDFLYFFPPSFLSLGSELLPKVKEGWIDGLGVKHRSQSTNILNVRSYTEIVSGKRKIERSINAYLLPIIGIVIRDIGDSYRYLWID